MALGEGLSTGSDRARGLSDAWVELFHWGLYFESGYRGGVDEGGGEGWRVGSCGFGEELYLVGYAVSFWDFSEEECLVGVVHIYSHG